MIKNKILLSLSRQERNRLLSSMEFIPLTFHQVIHEAGEAIKSAYFVNTGLVSVLTVQPDGKGVAVGIMGNEGFTALPLLVGYRTSPNRLIIHAEGTGYRCDADVLTNFVQGCPQLERQCIASAKNSRCRQRKSPPATLCMAFKNDWRGGC